MNAKDAKLKQLNDVSQKIHDTELAFEYEMGVEYQKQLMEHHEAQMKRKKEGESK